MGYFVSIDELGRKKKTKHFFFAEGDSEVGFLEIYLPIIGADNELTTVTCFKGNANLSKSGRTAVKVLEVALGELSLVAGLGFLGDSEDNPKSRIDAFISCAAGLAMRGAPKICEKMAGTPRVLELLQCHFRLVWLNLVGLRRYYSKRLRRTAS